MNNIVLAGMGRVASVLRAVQLAAFIMAAALATVLAADESGWKDLLAGKDLSKHWDTTGNWSLSSDGVVTLTPRPGEKGWERWSAYLWSKDKYQDFEIE